VTSIPLSLGSSKRSLMPEAVLLNAYVEPAPTQQEKPQAVRSRPGFTAFQTVGASRARCFAQKAGLFSDSAVVLSDQTAYLLSSGGVVTAFTGTVAGTGPVDAALGQDADLNAVARLATGSALYKVTEADGAVLEAFPSVGGPGASSICYHRGFWLAAEVGTDQVFFQVPGDTTWDALSFASAEYAPDPIVALRSRGDQIALLGQVTTEIWALTGEASPAIAPTGGLAFDFGCRSAASAVNAAGKLLWVDNNGLVRLFEGGEATAISDAGLAEQIMAVDAADLRASWYPFEGHQFYVLTLGSDSTWVYDLTTGHWHTQGTQGYDYLRPNMFATLGDGVFAADSASNQIYRVDAGSRLDGASSFPVRFTAFAELSEGQAPCANLRLLCETGQAPRTGQGSDPIIRMRHSDDEGASWSRWKDAGFGLTGQAAKRIQWNGLGTIKPPGRIFEFLISDPVGRRFSDARMNVAA
jgi:hypothetical protein